MQESLDRVKILLPDFFLNLLILVLMIPKKLVVEMDKITIENLHYYLQQYNIAQLVAGSVLFYEIHHAYQFIYSNVDIIKELNEWQLTAICGAPIAIWPILNKVWDSLNQNYIKSAKDVLEP